MKKLAPLLLAASMILAGAASLYSAEQKAAAATPTTTAPKSIIHVVTVKWKEGTSPEKIQAALDGVQALPGKHKGLLRVWTNAIKVQGDKTHAFVMEFADQAAFDAYTDSPAQLEWYDVYLPIRGQSTTFDITN